MLVLQKIVEFFSRLLSDIPVLFKGSILKYFQPSLSYHLSFRPLFCLFLSGRFTQVLLYNSIILCMISINVYLITSCELTHIQLADSFDFKIVNFPFLDGDFPGSTSYGLCIFQLIHFARASSYVTDFMPRNKLLTQKLLKQGYQYHKLRKTFSKFYRRYYDLISKLVGLKSLLRQGLSEPKFYGDLVYELNFVCLFDLILYVPSKTLVKLGRVFLG